jgi:hypothetical protein
MLPELLPAQLQALSLLLYLLPQLLLKAPLLSSRL